MRAQLYKIFNIPSLFRVCSLCWLKVNYHPYLFVLYLINSMNGKKNANFHLVKKSQRGRIFKLNSIFECKLKINEILSH